MSTIRKLAGQTAIYGLSSIVGRFLNYLLTPLYTSKGVFPPEEYGVITTFYAWAALIGVVLIYGMETTYFRFASRKGENAESAYSTAFWSVCSTSLLFLVGFGMTATPLADIMGLGDGRYVLWFAAILALDAITAIPMARLRQRGKAVRFAVINLINVAVNIGLNLFFIAYCMRNYDAGNTNALIDAVYDPALGVGYVFIINLISTAVKALLLLPEFPLKRLFSIDGPQLQRMLRFTAPLLLVGMAGMVNETADRIMLKQLLDPIIGPQQADAQVGIYGACYKLSILITLFVQAFRYAAEPFFFAKADAEGSGALFARVMDLFVAAVMSMFLLVMLFIDVFRYFIPNEAFWVGLQVVPILLLANVFLGIYYNQSVWYKLSDRTRIGGWIALFGALITIVLNWYWIPRIGYVGSAWATLICYAAMTVISYWLGQRYYPIPYRPMKVLAYIGGAVVLWWGSTLLPVDGGQRYAINAGLLIAYVSCVYSMERNSPGGLAADMEQNA